MGVEPTRDRFVQPQPDLKSGRPTGNDSLPRPLAPDQSRPLELTAINGTLFSRLAHQIHLPRCNPINMTKSRTILKLLAINILLATAHAHGETDVEISKRNIGCRDQLAQANYARAEAQCTAAEHLAARHAPNSVQHSTALFNLGALYTLSGDHQFAIRYFKHALAIRQRDLGPDHPHTATTMASLGRAYASQKNFGAARTYLSAALSARERILGPNHAEVGETLNDLGVVLYQLHEFAQAESLLEKALAIRIDTLGMHHPETEATRSNLEGARQRGSG